VKVKIAKIFISILTEKTFILDIITAKINMHDIFNVTYLKSKVELKVVSDTNSALNLEIMRKEIKISCLLRYSRQNGTHKNDIQRKEGKG